MLLTIEIIGSVLIIAAYLALMLFAVLLFVRMCGQVSPQICRDLKKMRDKLFPPSPSEWERKMYPYLYEDDDV